MTLIMFCVHRHSYPTTLRPSPELAPSPVAEAARRCSHRRCRCEIR